MESELLKDLVVIFAVAVATVVVLRRVGVPSVAGFILAGILVGPNVLRVVPDVQEVEVLAEVGVALLLFGIGLELSLDRVRRLWRLILTGGAIQVFATIAAVVVILWLSDFPVGNAVFFGCVIAVSSTAVVLSSLRARGELDSPHGRLTLGILIFQDLCVVPMILLIPLLSGSAPPGSLALAAVKSAVVLAAVLVGARFVVPHVLSLVARTRQRDLFVLSVFLVCIGTAWLVSAAGVSLALGAFLAGLVVASSEYRHQALSDLIPFREVFASVFFVSVGMLLDPRTMAGSALPILMLLVAIVLGKAVIAALASEALRLPVRVSILAGLSLAQVGEFSFVLLAAGQDAMVLPRPFTDDLAVAIVLSMVITPLVIAVSPRVAAGVGNVSVLTRRLAVRAAEDGASDERPLRDHVIIAGYGLTGQELARSLEDCGVSYIIVDINPENVRRAVRHEEPAYFGDVTSAAVLESLGVARARALVLVINDIGATVRSLHAARRVAPEIPVFVRVVYAADVNRAIQAGATEVIASELEASAEVTHRILERCSVGAALVATQVDRIRDRREDEHEDQQ